MRCLHGIVNHFISEAHSRDMVLLYEQIMEVTGDHVTAYLMRSMDTRINLLMTKSWLAPARIQYMVENADDENAFYHLAIENSVSQGAKSVYLYLLPRQVRYDRNVEFTCPEALQLVAQYVNDEIKIYPPGERPVVTKNEGFSTRFIKSSGHNYVAFLLFARAYQYGLMLCEIGPESIGILYGTALQISTARAYMEVSRQERETKKKLYKTLDELKEKNSILSFVSETDVLTGLYNRRGFVERAMNMIKNNTGSHAVILFSDLDHLKQINDVFGHKDGDFAIVHAAGMLKETVMSFSTEGSVCGRIGGDEFVAFMLCDDENMADLVLSKLKERGRQFNESCDKPYFVEFSTGCVRFVCEKDYSMEKLIAEADSCLYEEKKKRRSSVLK